jgi:hypothetical protein
MKKLVLLFILVACVVAPSPEPVHAISDLETWCKAQGAGWLPATNTCIVLSAKDATVTGTLALLSGETLSNFGAIGNDGTIDNDGTIYNPGTIVNHGTIANADYIGNDGAIVNHGTIANDGTVASHGTVSNYGAIDNDGTIANYDAIHNYSAIDNYYGIIYNYGTIYNLCMGIVLGSPPDDRLDGVTYNLNNCSFLPMVARN